LIGSWGKGEIVGGTQSEQNSWEGVVLLRSREIVVDGGARVYIEQSVGACLQDDEDL
jgi:hypothetical protein